MASQTDEQQRPPPQNQQTTQLEFYQAMRDFKVMFPEMDEDVIEAVLRSNNGAVDVTIDQLLAMSKDNENEKVRSDKVESAIVPELPSYSPGTPPPPYRQVMYSSLSGSPSNMPRTPPATRRLCTPLSTPPSHPKRQVTDSEINSVTRKNNVSESPDLLQDITTKNVVEDLPMRVTKNWKPPMLGPLPDSFLRIPTQHSRRRNRKVVLSSELLKQKMLENERLRMLEGSVDPDIARYLEDERMALLLQNEEFVTELRRNKDFMYTLDRDTRAKLKQQLTSQSQEQNVTSGGSTVTVATPMQSFSTTLPEESDTSSSMNPPEELMDAFPFTKVIPHDPESDDVFKEKLRNMGKLSRRKFARLASMFTRRKKKNSKGILGDGSAMSQDNLLLGEDELSDALSGPESEEEENDALEFNALAESDSVETRIRSSALRNQSKEGLASKYDII
ncbi:CUEDC1 (predicted) [Pycnogonum litorale]